MKLKPILLCLAIALTIIPNVSLSQENGLVNPQTTPSGIKYVSGGIGEGPQNEMKGLKKNYNFHLTFARPHSGEYLANVKVTVENVKTHEKTLDVVSEGPLFLAQIPDGKYKVTAEFEGKQQTKSTTIRKNLPRGIVFYFTE